jgi:hypothetical protein
MPALKPAPVLVLLLTAVVPVWAHHAEALFDRNNPRILEGVVREFRWTSPHAWLYVNVPQNATAADSPPGNGGADAWAFETASIAVMVRNGWKSNSLRSGDQVRLLVAPRRDGTRSGELLSVTLTGSGKVMKIGSN